MIKNSLKHFIIFQPQKFLKRTRNKSTLKEIQIQLSVQKHIIVQMVGKILVTVLKVVDNLL